MRTRWLVMFLAILMVAGGAEARTRTKAKKRSTTAQRTGDGLGAGDVIIRGDFQLDYDRMAGNDGVLLGTRAIAEYLVHPNIAVGGFVKAQYYGQNGNAVMGLLDFGPRVTAYLISAGLVHPFVGAHMGYHHMVLPGPDGKGVMVGPEVGVAFITGHFGAFVSMGYDFRWAKCGGASLKQHALPFTIGFGGRF